MEVNPKRGLLGFQERFLWQNAKDHCYAGIKTHVENFQYINFNNFLKSTGKWFFDQDVIVISKIAINNLINQGSLDTTDSNYLNLNFSYSKLLFQVYLRRKPYLSSEFKFLLPRIMCWLSEVLVALSSIV